MAQFPHRIWSIPVEVVVTQNGVKVADVTDYQTAGAATTLTNTISIPTDDLDLNADYTVDVYATVLEIQHASQAQP